MLDEFEDCVAKPFPPHYNTAEIHAMYGVKLGSIKDQSGEETISDVQLPTLT